MSFDLATNYGGLHLHSPLVMGACPKALQPAFRHAAFEAGVGAIVLPSLFAEQIIGWCHAKGHEITPGEQQLLEQSQRWWSTPSYEAAERYLQCVRDAADQLSIPIIANMNGYATGSWVQFAGALQDAGAAAIELNIHQGPLWSFRNSEEIEAVIIQLVSQLKQSTTSPVFLKIDPGLTSVPHLARRVGSGVDGIVLFGRRPDVDICLDTSELKSSWRLTAPDSAVSLIQPLMQTHAYCPSLSLAASGGISSGEDVAKVLLAGADVAMVTSAVYRSGPAAIAMLLSSLTNYMERQHLESLDQLRRHRPLKFSYVKERQAYVAALSEQLCGEPEESVPEQPCGDRYGHLQNLSHPS